MYYILHGDDELTLSEELKRLRKKMGDSEFAELNTTVLDGQKVSVSELRHHCDAVPFLADKRLVIVEGLLARLDQKQKKKGENGEAIETESNAQLAEDLLAYLPNLPDTTRLVFVENKALPKTNKVLKFAEKDKGRAFVKHFAPPDSRDLPHWITERAAAKGAELPFPVANQLALAVGADLRALDSEIDKLIAFCGDQPITQADVQALVASVREQVVWQFLDDLGNRKAQEALLLLHEQLRQGAAPQYLLSMIIRQYRLILQVKDLSARGKKEAEITQLTGLKTWSLNKLGEQAAKYTIQQLEMIYRYLLEVDLAMKTSQGDPAVQLDVLTVELTRR